MKEYLVRIHKTDSDMNELVGNDLTRNNDAGLVYNGTGSYTKISLVKKINKDNFTLYLKFTLSNVSNLTTSYYYIMNSSNLSLFISNSSLYFYDGIGAIDLGIVSTIGTTEHTLVFTRNGNTLTTYLDGTSKGTNTSTSYIDYGGDIFYLGCNKDSKYFTACSISEFVVINNYISDGTAQSNYFKLGEFCKCCQDYTRLTDDAKIELFNNTNKEVPTNDDILSTQQPIRILKYS